MLRPSYFPQHRQLIALLLSEAQDRVYCAVGSALILQFPCPAMGALFNMYGKKYFVFFVLSMSKAMIADIGFVENREISEKKVIVQDECNISELIRKSSVSAQPNQQRYILTGGPGAGKTSIINFLAQKGYLAVPEAATQIIEEDLNKDIKKPWGAEDYHLRM